MRLITRCLRFGLRGSLGTLMLLVLAQGVWAQGPRIANVHPDYPVGARGWSAPRIITGEQLDSAGLEILVWSPRGDEEAVDAVAPKLGTPEAPSIPDGPPAEARRVKPIDVESRVIVANLSGSVVWLRNEAGVSEPYVFDLPRPFWVSHDQAEPGQRLHIFGTAMDQDHGGPRTYAPKPWARIAFRQGDRTWVRKTIRQARQTVWTSDARLIYFHVPDEVEPGDVTLYAHNGRGGTYGWVRVGSIEVVAPDTTEPTIINVKDHGGAGDDLDDDTGAIERALAAAAEAERGVVFLPAGTWRVNRTIDVPEGVTLRGAARDATVIEGFGYQRHGGRIESVVRLASGTTLRGLTVHGAVSEGEGGNALVSLITPEGGGAAENIDILDCRLRGHSEDVRGRRDLYWAVLRWDRARRLNLLRNDLYGSIWFSRGDRLEIIGNKFHGGTYSINVSIHGWAYDSLLDDNIFTDTPGRVCFYPKRHTYVRFNEVHYAHRTAWANASEVYLVHGNYRNDQRFVGRASGGGRTTMSDGAQRWQDDALEEATVLIIGGRGFGQYRQIVSNTAETITVDRPWRVEPDETSEYCIASVYLENAFYNNLNNTPMVMSLWLDCVGNLVDRHRDEFSSGLSLWSGNGDEANAMRPSYFNIVTNGWLDGAPARMRLGSAERPLVGGPAAFGTMFVGNRFRYAHMQRTGKDRVNHGDGAIKIGGIPRNPDRLADDRLGASHTIITHNYFADTPIGVTVGETARKTMVLDNAFERVEHPVLDFGTRTVVRSNKRPVIDAQGHREEAIDDYVNERRINVEVPLALRRFELGDDERTVIARLRVTRRNSGDAAVTEVLGWATPEGSAWGVTPARATVELSAGESSEVGFKLTLRGGLAEARPLPKLVIERRGAEGEVVERIEPAIALDARALTAVREKQATVPRVDSGPKLDGELDDAVWGRARELAAFVAPDGGQDVRHHSSVRVAHDGQTLYLALRCAEPRLDRVRAEVTRRDGPVYQDDCVELFFDANMDRKRYRQLVVNAAGTRFDMSSEDRSWDGQWQAASGRVEAEDAGARAWTLEVAIPMTTIGIDAFEPGMSIGFNAIRFEPPRTRTMWSPVFSGTNHVPSRFGTLVLE